MSAGDGELVGPADRRGRGRRDGKQGGRREGGEQHAAHHGHATTSTVFTARQLRLVVGVPRFLRIVKEKKRPIVRGAETRISMTVPVDSDRSPKYPRIETVALRLVTVRLRVLKTQPGERCAADPAVPVRRGSLRPLQRWPAWSGGSA